MQKSYSHSGQDVFIYGLISWWEKPPAEITVMEVGARDGLDESNSRLFRERGYRCLLGEADNKYHAKLMELNSNNCFVSCNPISYSPGGLDAYIDDHFDGKSPDILFLDIDGGEYHLIEGSMLFPEIVCIEYNRNLMPDSMFIPKNIESGIFKQASPLAIIRMMLGRGYDLKGIFWNDMVFEKSLRPKPFEATRSHIVEKLIINKLVIDPVAAYVVNGQSHLQSLLRALEEEGGESDIKSILSHIQISIARLKSCSSADDSMAYLCQMIGARPSDLHDLEFNYYDFIDGCNTLTNNWSKYM